MIRRGIRRLFRLPPSDDEHSASLVEEEIELHLELRARQLMRAGLSPAAAHAEALRRFGPLDEARRELHRAARHERRTMRLRDTLDALRLDVRHAARGAFREPGFAAVVILTLALGIGANAAMFGVVDRLLLSGPPHVVDARGIVRLYLGYPDSPVAATQSTLSFAQYRTLRDETTSFAQLAAYGWPREVTLEQRGDRQRVRLRYATSTLFPLLGVQPALGRFFSADEDVPAAGARVAVLDHGMWLRTFGGDPSALGSAIVLDGVAYTIIGVAPRGFTGVDLEPVDLWLPIHAQIVPITADWQTSRSLQWVRVVGRLREGATMERATAEASAAEQRAIEAMGGAPEWTRTATMTPLPLWYDDEGREGMEATIARWLLAVAAVVLLIACANVANLLLARTVRRRREAAVRVALGAGRGRLIRLLVLEGMMLSAAGGIMALAVAWWGGKAVRATLLENVGWATSPVDVRILVFSLAATLATGLLVSVVPALRASRPSLVGALRQGTRQAGAERSLLRSGLTIAQAALSTMLLVGAGLLVASMWNVRGQRLGFDPDRVLLLELSWPRLSELPQEQRDAERVRRSEFRARLFEQVRDVPGVASTAMSAGTPFYVRMGTRLRVDGMDSVPQLPGGGPFKTVVSPGYFATVGTRILRGRPLMEQDRAGSELVALVNETGARTLWPNGDAIGKCIHHGAPTAPCTRIVGVTEDVHRLHVREERAIHVFFPIEQHEAEGPLPLVRAAGDPMVLAPALRARVMELDPTLRWVNVVLLQDRVSPQLRPWRLGATLFTVFGALALLVAAVGLYSVMSYATAQRTHELGVRMALGAQPGDVRRLILRAGLTLAAAGTTLGLMAALAAARWTEPLLFGISPRDPVVVSSVAALLLVVSLAATLLPARRAARVDPARALAAE